MPQPFVVIVRGKGHAAAHHAHRVIVWRERALASKRPIVLFDDLEEMHSYESEVRLRLTRWIAINRSRIEAVHILMRSKIASMGVTLANLALGGFIRSYTRRDEFERELRRFV